MRFSLPSLLNQWRESQLAARRESMFSFTPQHIFAFIATVILSLGLNERGWFNALDQKLYDEQIKFSRNFFPEPALFDPVIVGLDEKFLDSIDEPLTLSHFHLARLLTSLSEAGADVIAMDVTLPEKRYETVTSNREGDTDFHRALLKGMLETTTRSKMLVAKIFDQERRHYRHMQLDFNAVLSNQSSEFSPLASVHLCADSDNRIRAYPSVSCQPDASSLSFSSEIAAAAGRREEWSGYINYRIGDPFSYISAAEVLALANAGKAEQLKQKFGGKVVLIGSTQEYVDLLNVPIPLARWLPKATVVPGVLIHAQILRGMLNANLVQILPTYLVALISIFVCLLWFVNGLLRKLGLLFLVIMGVFSAGAWLFQQDTWLPHAAILASVIFSVVASASLQAWRHYRDKQRLSKAFTGRVSPTVMKEIIHGDAGDTRSSERLPVCVLFSDVRNFTTMCEHMPAEEVVSLLNRYFAVMVTAIHQQGGTVDKFIGDGLMAFFGAPNTLSSPEKNAYHAAQAMLQALSIFNAELQDEGRATWAIGIGLHTGEAVIGHLGSAERHEYTAIGDVVNTTARLESLCKELGSTIVCSEELARALDFPTELQKRGEQALKGRSAVCVYTYGELNENKV